MSDQNQNPMRPGRGPVLASVTLHVVAVVVAFWLHGQADQPQIYESFQIEIVALSADDLEVVTLPEEQVVVETPPQELPEPEPEPEPEPPPPDPTPDPTPTPPAPRPEPRPDPTPPRPTPPAPTPTPTPTPAETADAGANIAVRMEGLRRDFPEYYRNILLQISRCFRAPGTGTWTTTVVFEIQADGSVPGRTIRVERRSGNTSFDVAAVGAVECAGAGRFGPLPPELPWNELPIQFTFTPSGAGGGQDLSQ